MAYSHINSKGQTYYLHANKIKRSSGKVTTLYYFSRKLKAEKALDAVPGGYKIIELNNALPVLAGDPSTNAPPPKKRK
jgi:hypothetical protein